MTRIEEITMPIADLIEAFGEFTPKVLRDFTFFQTIGRVYAGYVDEEFICCWGLIPPTFLSNQAYLWMWGPEPIKHQFILVRQSQIQIQNMLKRYDKIVGHCLVGAKGSQRWLRWLGAEFAPAEGDVLPFEIRRG